MRYVYWFLIILFSSAIAIFMLQNLNGVTVGFLTLQATLPLALLVIAVYILGMTTGGLLTTALGQWIRGARKPQAELPGGSNPDSAK